eukprot:RCo038288
MRFEDLVREAQQAGVDLLSDDFVTKMFLQRVQDEMNQNEGRSRRLSTQRPLLDSTFRGQLKRLIPSRSRRSSLHAAREPGESTSATSSHVRLPSASAAIPGPSAAVLATKAKLRELREQRRLQEHVEAEANPSPCPSTSPAEEESRGESRGESCSRRDTSVASAERTPSCDSPPRSSRKRRRESRPRSHRSGTRTRAYDCNTRRNRDSGGSLPVSVVEVDSRSEDTETEPPRSKALRRNKRGRRCSRSRSRGGSRDAGDRTLFDTSFTVIDPLNEYSKTAHAQDDVEHRINYDPMAHLSDRWLHSMFNPEAEIAHDRARRRAAAAHE